MHKLQEQKRTRHRGFKLCVPLGERRIISPIQIVEPHRDGENYKIFEGAWHALWDTGAMSSTISSSLAEQLQLPELGDYIMHGAGGTFSSKQYLAGLILPNSVSIPFIPLYGFAGAADFDMLIGMDIISMGDFLISSEEKNMCFSFQLPSCGGFYLDDIQKATLHDGRNFQRSSTVYNSTPKIGRNELCHCGSGLKFKKCHGKTDRDM